MSDEIADLIAKRFIARRDVKAIQFTNGAYVPHTVDLKDSDSKRIPWSRADLNDHLSRKKTFGHYMLNKDDQCKLFAFDIDLEKTGTVMTGEDWEDELFVSDLRAEWLKRDFVGRPWLKFQFKQIAHMFMRAITDQLEIPCAAAYSGAKGVHVYGFTGLMPAGDAREAMKIVLDSLERFHPLRGENFWKDNRTDTTSGFGNFSIETYPKQASLEGKDLGNLLRAPLGRNRKSNDPTFFIDMMSPMAQMIPVDPVWALTTDDPWKKSNE